MSGPSGTPARSPNIKFGDRFLLDIERRGAGNLIAKHNLSGFERQLA